MSSSYVTNEEADEILDIYDLSGVWESTSENNKTKCLKRATMIIDQFDFAGRRYDLQQELKFPRIFYNKCTSVIFDIDRDGSVIVPNDIKKAVCYEALRFATMIANPNEQELLRKVKTFGIQSISIKSTSESYSKDQSSYNRNYDISSESMMLIEKFLVRGL